LFQSGRFFILNLLPLALHGINCDSAGNYYLMDEESTGGIIIPPGITSSGTQNPPEECDSARNYHLIDEISTQGKGFHLK
jgi:hypothetical protein